MQMGRWFGYRTGYEDLCHIYMPREKMNEFAEIIRATEDLMNDFRLMSENEWTPNDFGLAVKENPDSALQITARNKQNNVKEFYQSMRLDGKAKETSILSSDQDDISENLSVVKSLVNSLKLPYINISKSYLWRDIHF